MKTEEKSLTTLRKELLACQAAAVRIKEEIKKRQKERKGHQWDHYHRQWEQMFKLVIRGHSAAEAARKTGVSVHNAADKVEKYWRMKFAAHRYAHRDHIRRHGVIQTLHKFPPLM